MINLKSSYFFLGNILGQMISLITAVFIIKNISPDDFGRFSIFTSIGSIIGSFATLKFELSISISSNISEAFEKLNFSIIVSTILNLIFVATVLPFVKLGGMNNILLLFVFAICTSLNGSLQQIFLFREDHLKNGVLSLMLSLFNFLFILYIFRGDSVLIKSNVFANLIVAVIFIFTVYRSGFSFKIFSMVKLKEMFNGNIQYVKYILPGSVATILLSYFHPILLALIFKDKEVGVFSFSLRIMSLPTIIIGVVVSGLLRARISKLFFDNNFEQIRKEVRRAIKLLLGSSIVAFSCLVIIIYNLSFFINIDKWKGLEMTSILLLFYCVAQYFYVPLSNLAMVFGENKKLLKYNIIQLVITALTYLGTYIFNFSFHQFLILLSFVFVTFSFYTCVKFYSLTQTKVKPR